MDGLLLAVAVLACPVGMGLMMVLMMRSGRQVGGPPAASDAEHHVAELRSEVERLKADRTRRQPSDGGR